MHCYHDFTSHIGQASGVLPRFVDALGQQQQITACFQCLRLYTHLLTHQFFMWMRPYHDTASLIDQAVLGVY